MIVGHWKLAVAGHYYRRRKSRYNNWYTQTRSAAEHQAYINNQLEQKTSSYARQKANESRLEPGYWPTKEDKTKVEWAEKDPTYISPTTGCIVWPLLNFAMLYCLAASNGWGFAICLGAAWYFQRLNKP